MKRAVQNINIVIVSNPYYWVVTVGVGADAERFIVGEIETVNDAYLWLYSSNRYSEYHFGPLNIKDEFSGVFLLTDNVGEHLEVKIESLSKFMDTR